MTIRACNERLLLFCPSKLDQTAREYAIMFYVRTQRPCFSAPRLRLLISSILFYFISVIGNGGSQMEIN